MAILKRWFLIARIPAVLCGVAFFFTFYNRFLVDVNLQSLKVSLGVLDQATSIGQAEAALLLVDQTLIASMAQEEVDLTNLSLLQYAQGALASDEKERSVEDVQFMVNQVAKDRASIRPGLLATLDGLAAGAQNAFRQVALIPRGIGKGAISGEMDVARLQQAMQQERRGQLKEAAPLYEGLLKDYPNYSGQGTLKLRLAYSYARIQEFDKAERLYREVLRGSRESSEIEVAQLMLTGLSQARGVEQDAKRLAEQLTTLGAGPERQRAAFQLGSLWLKLYAMEEAAEAFHSAALADPEGELVLPSLFREAWCQKYLGQFEQAMKGFQGIIQRDPTGSWAAASQIQMAEVHKIQGEYEMAIEAYDQILKNSKDISLIAIALAQAGATATYDLRDPERGRGFFNRLSSQFPASPASAIDEDLSRLQTQKAALALRIGRPLTAGAPLLGWVQMTLPVFVQVFAERLVQYMEAAGEMELTRKYTEEEFRNIVVRKVQQRFPGQVQAVQVSIHPNGYVGSCMVRLGPLSFPVGGRVGIKVVNDRVHVVFYEMRVWKIGVMDALRKQLESQVNGTIDRLRLPLKIKEYELGEGYAFIRVERVEQNR